MSAILKTKLPYLSPEPPVILLPLASTHKQNWGGRVSVFLGKINLFNCTWPVQDTEIENHLSLCLENALIIRVSWRQVKPRRRPTFCVHVTNCRLGLKCNLIFVGLFLYLVLFSGGRTTVQELERTSLLSQMVSTVSVLLSTNNYMKTWLIIALVYTQNNLSYILS